MNRHRRGTSFPVPDQVSDELGRQLAEISASDRVDRQQLAALLKEVTRSARSAGTKAVVSGTWLADVLQAAAGHIRPRDLPTLQQHHHGLAGPLLADALIRNAGVASAGIGAATGAIAAASELTPTTWVSLPVELLAETAVVVALELKLVAELHAVAGCPITGRPPTEVGFALVKAWAGSRGVQATDLIGSGAGDMLGRQARTQLSRQLRRRLMARTGRSLGSFAPMLIGAAVGAALNRKATQAVGRKVSESLGLPIPS